jgi:hypothetical protein
MHSSLGPQLTITNPQQADDQSTNKGDTETQEGLQRPNVMHSFLEPQLMITNPQQADDQSTNKGDTEMQEGLQQPNATHSSLEPQLMIINRQSQVDDQGTSKGDTETQEGLQRPTAMHLSSGLQPAIVDRQQQAEVSMTRWLVYYNAQSLDDRETNTINELQCLGSNHMPAPVSNSVSIVAQGDATSEANAQLVVGMLNQHWSSKSKWISNTAKDVCCLLSVCLM